jgi:hypothetical protein
MSMETNLQGRLRNTTLPPGRGLLAVFEAVVNSIHAIEEAQVTASEGSIQIEIRRDPPQRELELEGDGKKRGPEPLGEIRDFRVTDNGVGFTDGNLKSFMTLDTDHKAGLGGRGVGRLLWLKAFRAVRIQSTFVDADDKHLSRKFVFNRVTGVDKQQSEPAMGPIRRSTTVYLEGFEKRYRDASYKTAKAIANSMLEHCLWYFVRPGGCPSISIVDGDEQINLEDVYEQHMVSSADTETIQIHDQMFDLIHVRLRTNSSQAHTISYCASSRLVKEERLGGRLPGLFGKLQENGSDFVYSCYVSSQFLDDNVRAERTDFDIAENVGDLFAETEISLSLIRDSVIARAGDYLADYLQETKKRSHERVEAFVSQKAPRYRPILAHIPEANLCVDPTISDKELDLTLHKQFAEIEERLLADGHDVMSRKENEDIPDYQKRLREYLRTAADIKKSDLANYVSHRRVILDLLEKAIQKGEDGAYAREDMIHELIMPMRTTSDDNWSDDCNLWLLDERLAFHNYLASDVALATMPITGSADTKEPDLCALNVFSSPILVSEGTKLPLASIVVVELKRPMRDDAKAGEDKDPIEQALAYLDRIRQGRVKTANGRPIPKSDTIPGFCYVVCDITPSIQRRIKIHDLIGTSDGLAYFTYNKNYNAYIELMSFDRLVNAAKERNRAFFDKLGLPTT